MYFTRNKQFLMTETYICNNKWICTTKYPHNVVYSNTYNFHHLGIPDQTYLKYYYSEIVEHSDGKLTERQDTFATALLQERNVCGCAENLQT